MPGSVPQNGFGEYRRLAVPANGPEQRGCPLSPACEPNFFQDDRNRGGAISGIMANAGSLLAGSQGLAYLLHRCGDNLFPEPPPLLPLPPLIMMWATLTSRSVCTWPSGSHWGSWGAGLGGRLLGLLSQRSLISLSEGRGAPEQGWLPGCVTWVVTHSREP